MTTLSLQQWHQRYQQQARWTYHLREYVYHQVAIQSAHRILEVGCGTGVILEELRHTSPGTLFGLDISLEPLSMFHRTMPQSPATQGDVLQLPFHSNEFNISLCHFLLLWVKDPLQAIKEMARVTQQDGYVLALAEPDYGGRIDFPLELAQIGLWQTQALMEQGANPCMGRELRSLFFAAGLHNIEVGVVGGQWVKEQTSEDFDLEWQVINSDLYDKREFIEAAGKLKSLELASRENHQRVLYVPTFYALGRV